MSAPTLPKHLSDLPIAGIIPFSATDWPGKLTITAFTQGCPLRCVYCHNAQLQEFAPGAVGVDDLVDLARRRIGLIDAVVISGGEPTAVPGLAEAICRIHDLGLPVGLHTCGYAPKRLATLVSQPESRPDWIGLDIKALPRRMHEITGCSPRVAQSCWESLAIIDAVGIEVQTRTTLWPGSVIEQNLRELEVMVAAQGHELVVQQARF